MSLRTFNLASLQSAPGSSGNLLAAAAQLVQAAHIAPAVLNTRDAAAYLGCSEKHLERGRVEGWGPKFCQTGPRRVAYRRQALDEWLASREVKSTSAAAVAKAKRAAR